MGLRDRMRENSKAPAEPWYLMLVLILAVLVSIPTVYRFVVERVIIGELAWLNPRATDILIAEHFLGGFEDNAYGNFLLAIAAVVGVVAGLIAYTFFLPFYRLMARGDPIPNGKLVLPGFGDFVLGYFLTAGLATALASIAGTPGITFAEVVSPSSFLADVAFAGYAVGSSKMKFAIGVWWRRKLISGPPSRPSAT